MRHPNPFISLLSFMLLFRIRANSHQQPLNVRAPEDCYRCGSLQLALTAYFRNIEAPSLTDHMKYWTETIQSLGYRNGMLTRFEIPACPPHIACRRPALGSASVYVALSSDRNRHEF